MRCGECSLNWIHLLTFALLFGVNKPTYGNKATSSPAVLQNLLTFEQDLTVVEQDDGTVTLEVAVVVASNNVVTSNYTVDYATVDGTATTADSDYVATSGTLTFTPNDSRQVFTVTINGDEMFEADETFTVLLSNITGPGSIADGEITITIVNDDTPSAYTWTGAEDTNWGNTNNWDVGQVPGATDSVVVPAVTNAPLVNTGFARVGSIEVSGGDLTVASGTILILQNRATGITVNNGGVVAVNGPLTMSGQQASGILVEDGQFTVGANSQVSVSESFVEVSSASTFAVNGTLLVEDAVVEGLIVGSGTTFTIANTGEVNILSSGNNGVSLGDATAQIVNNGVLSVLGSDAFTTIGGTITNTAGSRLIVEGDVSSTSIFNTGSTLQVGGGIARLLFREPVDLAGATVELELEGTQPNTDQDVILFSEEVDLTGANLVLAGSYLPAIGDEFGIHNLAGPNASYMGTYDGLAEGSTLVYNGAVLEISYVGGPIGTDVTLTAIEILTPPENDDLANAIVLDLMTNTHLVASENAAAATTEAEEINCDETVSWWYAYTPERTTEYQVITFVTNLPQIDPPVAEDNDLTLGLYTGTSFPLTELVCLDNDASSGGGEFQIITLTAGQTYYLRVGAKSAAAVGDVRTIVSPFTKIWEGNVNSSWSEPGNWLDRFLPVAGDDVVIVSGQHDPVLVAGEMVELRQLSATSGGNITISEGSTLTMLRDDNAASLIISDASLTVGGTLSVTTGGGFGVSNSVDGRIVVTSTGSLTTNGGGIVTSAALTVAGSVTINDAPSIGIFHVADTLRVMPTGILNIADPVGDGIFTRGAIEIEGAVSISGAGDEGLQSAGDGSVHIHAQGTLTIDDVADIALAQEAADTLVNQGTLVVSNAIQSFAQGVVEVQSGATLRCSGDIESELRFATNSRFEPGDGVNCTVFNVTPVFEQGAIYSLIIEGLEGCEDFAEVTFDLDGSLDGVILELGGDYAPQVGNRFPIIFSDGSPISGMFADLPTGSTIPFNGVELDITFVRGNVTLTAIAILPLDLLSFTGEARNKTNLLTWTTANAEDFSHFVVQRSPDGRGPWSVLAQPDLQASGEHEYIDELPLPSAYYRLKMIDLDGTFSYSEVIFLEHFSGEDAGAMQVYPNPSTGRFSVDFTKVNLPSGREGELCLVDLHGRQIWARKISGDQPTLPVALSQPGGGVYLLTLVTDDGRAFKQRVVIR